MAYMKKAIRDLVEEMKRTFTLPSDWERFIYEIEKNHNLIIKTGKSYYCTCCQQTFTVNQKIGKMYVCPCCNVRSEVKSNRLKHLTYKDNVLLLNKCDGKLILRIFEMMSVYRADRQEFEHYTDEYCRKIIDEDFMELRNERITPGITAFSVNHGEMKNEKWRIYTGYWRGIEDAGYVYTNNIEDVLRGTCLERSRLWEAMPRNLTKWYQMRFLLREAENPIFETLIELKLYNLANYARLFHGRGSFYKIFGVEKKYYDFMKENDINYDELEVLREYPSTDIKKIRFLVKYRSSLEEIKKYVSIDKFIEYFQSNSLEDSRLYIDYLRFAKQLGYDLKNKRYLFPQNLAEMHDQYLKQIKDMEDRALARAILRRAKKLARNTYEDKTFIIFPAGSVQALTDESTQQNNCVRTYADKYAKGVCDIYFMRNVKDTSTSLVTVEVRGNKVEQQRIKNNADTTKKQKQFLKNWERKVLSKVAT